LYVENWIEDDQYYTYFEGWDSLGFEVTRIDGDLTYIALVKNHPNGTKGYTERSYTDLEEFNSFFMDIGFHIPFLVPIDSKLGQEIPVKSSVGLNSAALTEMKTSSINNKELEIFEFTGRNILDKNLQVTEESIIVQYDKMTGMLVKAILTGTFATQEGWWSIETGIVATDISETKNFSSETSIPDWIRNNAKWWSQGAIGDNDFVSGIQYLIQEGIMQIPETVSLVDGGSQEIPTWIKNNADWWSRGLISDEDFVSGIQYLIENGIIKV